MPTLNLVGDDILKVVENILNRRKVWTYERQGFFHSRTNIPQIFTELSKLDSCAGPWIGCRGWARSIDHPIPLVEKLVKFSVRWFHDEALNPKTFRFQFEPRSSFVCILPTLVISGSRAFPENPIDQQHVEKRDDCLN